MIISIILLLAGFLLLVKGADFFVDGSSSLASKLNISQIVIGLTIVAFGTSTPELIVNVFAAIERRSDISFGNIVGSNIINIFLILGIAALITPLKTQKNTVWKEIPFALLGAVVLLILCNDTLLGTPPNMISVGDGIVLLLFFIIFIVYIFAISKVESDDRVEVKNLTSIKIFVFITLGGANDRK